ncbi:MAG TPA: PspA/IM30 family protein [Longimicrobiaceae bacterium]|jgi:phage shock protein A|nr:PspA/IM30 family protein [Longimicrobiaceae bacterium]
MGIFQKLSTLIKSNLNDAIARAENPEKMLNQVIDDMRNQLIKAKQEVALAMADESKLKKQVDDEHRQAQEWERRAMLAVQNGKDDLARQALVRHQEYAQRSAAMYETWERQSSETLKLRDALRQLNVKIEEAQRKKTLLLAKQKRAEAQKRIHETMSGLSDSSAFEAFNRMAERIDQNERQALAAATLSEDLTGDPLDREFKQLESGTSDADVDFRLIELKQQMGILPPPAPAAQAQLSAGGAAGEAPAAETPAQDRVREAELLEEFESMEEEERGRAHS